MATGGKVWDLGELLAPVAKDGAKVRYALILLNTPIPHDHWRAFVRLWRRSDLRICADGAANRLLDSVGTGAWSEMPLPSMICGDLDSVREDVRGFFEEKVRENAHIGCRGSPSALSVRDRSAKVCARPGGR